MLPRSYYAAARGMRSGLGHMVVKRRLQTAVCSLMSSCDDDINLQPSHIHRDSKVIYINPSSTNVYLQHTSASTMRRHLHGLNYDTHNHLKCNLH